MSTIFPWLTSTWEQLISYKKNARLPSALLITGAEGIGKSQLAEQFAQYVLCHASSDQSCGDCRSCQLFLVGNHPDYILMEPEEDSSIIKIDQIRKIVHFLDQTKSCSAFQVVILKPAENLNRAAANSLLKTLEEPRGSVLIILVSQKPFMLPATIRSRCQQMKLPIPRREQTLAWLKNEVGEDHQPELLLSMANDLPLKAIQYANNNSLEQFQTFFQHFLLLHAQKAEPIQIAQQFMTNNCTELLVFMLNIIMDLIRLKFQPTPMQLTYQDKILQLQVVGQQCELAYLFAYFDKLIATIQLVNHNASANRQLLLEKLLICWYYKDDVN